MLEAARGRVLINRAFGQTLNAFLYSPHVFRILGDEGTWSSGGCWILAEALRRWIGPEAELKTVASDRCPTEHVVVRISSQLFIHASGVVTRKQLLREMRLAEGLRSARIVNFNLRAMLLTDIPRPGDKSPKLLCALRRRFGRPEISSPRRRMFVTSMD